MYWNHRIFEHRNSKDTEHEVYHTVHEVYYLTDREVDEPGKLYAARPASPRSREEAEWILRAFDKPVVGWFDDASFRLDEKGFETYDSWGWLE